MNTLFRRFIGLILFGVCGTLATPMVMAMAGGASEGNGLAQGTTRGLAIYVGASVIGLAMLLAPGRGAGSCGRCASGAPPAEPEADVLETCRRLALEGRKIDAIKAYRTATGAGLKESKEAVERLVRRAA